MPKISVIVPIYNVEEYLPECLEAFSRQSFQDFELILVDDESPDNCGALCDAYGAEHPNTIVIHQENGGVSKARNQGVKASRGEYITFVDPDDYVTPDYLEHLLYLAEKYGVEVSAANNVKVWPGKEPVLPSAEPVEICYETVEALRRICYGKVSVCAWAKLYKRHLVEQFPYPVGQIYEDLATTYKIFGATENVAYSTKVVYYWRQRSGSITHERVSERHFVGMTAAREQLEYMRQNYPSAVPAARARCVKKCVELSYRLVSGTYDPVLFRRTREELKPLLGPVLWDKNVARAVKLRALALRMGYMPYRLLSAGYNRLKKDKL